MGEESSAKMRIRLQISYQGRQFHGWACQPGLRTVQGEIEKVLSTILRIPISLTVAGRTDAGVHAAGQVAHFDVPATLWEQLPGRANYLPEDVLLRRANSLLTRAYWEYCRGEENAELEAVPSEAAVAEAAVASTPAAGAAPAATGLNLPIRGYSDVVITRVEKVPADFDARFSALWRKYVYLIADGVEHWNPARLDVLWIPEELDIERMNRAALPLLGEHDFTSFCRPRPGASSVRTLLKLQFSRQESGILAAQVQADAFCHSQVRMLVGALIEVGRGRRAENWPAESLRAQERNGETVCAPAHGLTLAEVGYPPSSEYAAQAQRARRYRGD
ncbi:tRNA pseudouridine(38-40) synthase TruA [uncultured Arcanobacterium sp.]|uniref:tRNA pseudouridine synthase A n=1 Tax=uncultured Arcanobacterium sp. TaxID=487520 RepID=UPI002628F112|nr:tRNA pseudouridine synthase A [uncultured Arcanobacterium sp.]